MSSAFNDYAILADRSGHAALFYFESMTVVYDFGNLLEAHSVGGQWNDGMRVEQGIF